MWIRCCPFNTRLILAIRASARLSMKDVEGGGRRQLRGRERYTLTLVIVVIVFVVCELPDLFLRSWMLFHRISPGQVSYPLDTLRAVNIISNLCLTVNSSVNVVIYCFVGRRFRAVMVRVICCNATQSRGSHHRRHGERRTRTSGRAMDVAERIGVRLPASLRWHSL